MQSRRISDRCRRCRRAQRPLFPLRRKRPRGFRRRFRFRNIPAARLHCSTACRVRISPCIFGIRERTAKPVVPVRNVVHPAAQDPIAVEAVSHAENHAAAVIIYIGGTDWMRLCKVVRIGVFSPRLECAVRTAVRRGEAVERFVRVFCSSGSRSNWDFRRKDIRFPSRKPSDPDRYSRPAPRRLPSACHCAHRSRQ